MTRKPVILASLLLSQATWAQVDLEDSGAYLRQDTGELHISSGAVVSGEGDIAHFRDIMLLDQGDGSFRVAAAEDGELIPVETVSVQVGGTPEELQLEVEVTGNKSACVEPIDPITFYEDGTFTVALPESEPSSEVCILVLEPYQTTFTLEPGALESGSYTVVVNGVEATFEV